MASKKAQKPQTSENPELTGLTGRKKKGSWLLLLPIYLFTLIFVFAPLVYMVFLSFMSRAEVWGYVPEFTLDNYKRILEPLYFNTFVDSLKLALISTVAIMAIGYPFGYFMARMSAAWKKRMMFLLMLPFWTSTLIRINGWIIVFRSNGVLDKILMGLHITEKPLKLLYTYPAVVVGMIYVLVPFMILSVYSSAEKMDWSLVEAARDLGASRRQAFCSITFVHTLPGLLSGTILTFVPSMGLFFIADILGGNKIVLVGNVIQEQLTKGRNLPFAAALSVVLLVLTSLFIRAYQKISHSSELEGLY
ncbi:MAG: ABC transporter permease [Eubacteriales bacterium]|nr:ABC transporter permease [Eubacteriales bacterium]